MKIEDIIIGKMYRTKIQGKLARVRIDREHWFWAKVGVYRCGWDATNLETGQTVFVRSALRLHCI